LTDISDQSLFNQIFFDILLSTINVLDQKKSKTDIGHSWIKTKTIIIFTVSVQIQALKVKSEVYKTAEYHAQQNGRYQYIKNLMRRKKGSDNDSFFIFSINFIGELHEFK
jgi:hypothetical protein